MHKQTQETKPKNARNGTFTATLPWGCIWGGKAATPSPPHSKTSPFQQSSPEIGILEAQRRALPCGDGTGGCLMSFQPTSFWPYSIHLQHCKQHHMVPETQGTQLSMLLFLLQPFISYVFATARSLHWLLVNPGCCSPRPPEFTPNHPKPILLVGRNGNELSTGHSPSQHWAILKQKDGWGVLTYYSS